MKTRFICLLTLIAATALSAGETSRTDINPALLYARAFLLQPDLSQADSDYLSTNHWQGQALPARFETLIARYDRQFELLCQAAQSTVPCDWGIDLSPGPATLLPHLSRAKAVALTAKARVPWHLQHGRQDQACRELLASFALARNVPRDGLLISTLVQIAMEAINCGTVAENFGRFPPDTLKQLAAGLENLPRRTLADCLPTEKRFLLNRGMQKVLEVRRQYPGDDARVMATLEEAFGLVDADPETRAQYHAWWQTVTNAAGGTSEGLIRLMREQEQLFDKAARIFPTLPYTDYEKQANAFNAELEKSSNPLARESIPGIVRARQREYRIEASLAMVRAAIEYRLHGEKGLQSAMDPCGTGSFAFRRFAFEGVDRGFELESAFNLGKNRAVLIFVEKDGPPFQVDGNHPGRALPKAPQQ